MKSTNNKTIKILKDGGIGVLLTDTLYGVVGQALNKEVIDRIYKIKERDVKKPLIILISSVSELKKFGIKADSKLKIILEKYWPGPTSIILPCLKKEFEYLHRGTKTLAFRIPRKKTLIEILKKTGPLVAPSANPETLPVAQNITEAKKYFADKVDFYLKSPKSKNKPSSIIKINDGTVEVVRK